MKTYELNMDGLVGPSHHYAGLGAGNIASLSNAMQIANPAAAAHQGIQKMRLLHQLGMKQAILPPHARPNLAFLSALGFSGTPAEQLKHAFHVAPEILSASYSASSMWTANAATIASSSDTRDQRVHFLAANLVSHLHRHQEADFSYALLKKLFPAEDFFYHHPPLPKNIITADEGAANHTRLCQDHADTGIHLFVYGKQALPIHNKLNAPLRFPARQTLEASQAVARNLQLSDHQTVFALQNPHAIDEGVFHNDVIAVGNESLFLVHQEAFLHQQNIYDELHAKANFNLQMIEVKSEEVSLKEAIDSYLFNSQLITLEDNTKKRMALIAPIECEQQQSTRQFIARLITDKNNPVEAVHYLNLKQSMRNGGGPACLRLRVVLNEKELAAMHPGVLINDDLLDALDVWADKHYRDQLCTQDLVDPAFMNECFFALDELTTLLKLGPIYPFQR